MGNYIVGITGASGTIYGKKVIEHLLMEGHHVYICMTHAGEMVAETELGWFLEEGENHVRERYLKTVFQEKERLHCYDVGAIGETIASGSFGIAGMIVVPCSMGTLSAICHGASDNLLERAADVCLKERIRLVLVPREAPYNQIHLENMLKLSKCGAVIMPASPGFYANPESLDELVDFFAVRLLDQLEIKVKTKSRWKGLHKVV